MPTPSPHRLLTPRDIEILNALDRCPLTASQVLRISETFALPFTCERRVRARLQLLGDAGRVCRWRLATAGQGAPNYYTLSRLGFRLLHGDDAVPWAKRAFDPVGLSRQHHTQCHADFVVQTAVSAHRGGLDFTGFYRENTLRLQAGDESLYPDNAFQLAPPEGTAFGFFTEIDAGTERVRSPKDAESWERKIRTYDRFQDQASERFRVLVVSTRGGGRVRHILELAGELMRNPQRTLFLGISLPEYLATADPLRSECFRDHRGMPAALVPNGLTLTPAWNPVSTRVLPPSRLPSLATQALGHPATGV